LTSEDIVEPLVQVKQSKKRAYRRPSRREIVRRCIQLSREIRSQCDSAGTGEVSLYDTKFLEGRNLPKPPTARAYWSLRLGKDAPYHVHRWETPKNG
jgi:hypothetical protein